MNETPDARTGRITPIALAFAAGIAAGAAPGAPAPATWIVGATVALAVAVAARHRAVLALGAIAAAVAALGGAWIGVRQNAVAPGDLVARVGPAPASIHVVGTALDAPTLRDAGVGGALAGFDYRGPFTEFSLAVEALIERDGRRTPARGTLLVRVDETVEPFAAGDRMIVRGYARRGAPARNPGGFDHDRFLRSRGYAGVLTVGRRALLTVTPVAAPGVGARIARARAALRDRAEENLFGDLPPGAARDAVLGALLFGRRDRGAASVGAAFRRVGLAHLLAISGLHLGILVALVLFAAGGHLRARPRHAVLVAGVVIVYLLLIDVRLPVLRAAVMTTAGLLARTGRRRWPGTSLVALSATGLLAWRPQQLFEPGFQLSFGVVLALVHCGPAVRMRWFGSARNGPTTVRSILARALGAAVATAVVAWAIATPITVYHFGMISPGAVPLSVIALPAVTALLALGYLKILLASVMPSAAYLLGLALVPITDGLVALVESVDAWSLSVLHVPRPAAPWALAATAWSVAWAYGSVSGRGRWRRRAWVGGGAVLAVWLAWPVLRVARAPDLRIDTLAVGNGACHVLRSGGRAAMFDAGSTSNMDAGGTVVLPALRALGVGALDWIAISHANLDHYSAVPEIAAAFPGAAIIITPQFLRAAARDPEGPAAFLLRDCKRNAFTVEVAAGGAARSLGPARMRWLHPQPDDRGGGENDHSMVLLVETGGRRALFTGDIERPAIVRLLDRHPALTADILELPHHGSFSPAAAAFVDRIDPLVVLQSTGHRRLERDAWAKPLARRHRLVTARDGAIRVEVERGTVRCAGFGDPWQTVVPPAPPGHP